MDEDDCKLVELLEVVRGVGGSFGLPPQPLEVLLQGVNVFLRLCLGIGVVVSEDCATICGFDAELLECEVEVHVHGFGVADVEEAIGLGGKARADDGAIVGLVGLEGARCVHGPL